VQYFGATKGASRTLQTVSVAPKSTPPEALSRNARDLLEKRPLRKRYFTAPETLFALDRTLKIH
jgi:hypothetical protein